MIICTVTIKLIVLLSEIVTAFVATAADIVTFVGNNFISELIYSV